MSDQNDILAHEQKRIDALIAADYAGLAALLTDDLVHVHANGSAQDKAAFLATIEAQLDFVEMVRGDQSVRVYGDIAVSNGPLKQTVRVKADGSLVTVDIFTTQVWQRAGDGWRQCSFHATRPAQH